MGKWVKAWRRWRVPALLVAGVWLVAGCQTLGYYAQSVGGHAQLMNAARPVDEWLADPQTSPALQQRLRLALEMREFASRELALPDNASYRRYADLQRRAAVWNVAAAPPDSLRLKTWCFVVLGCVSYRGYFDEAEAQALGRQLREEGWEVDVYPVPAYSTLGWLNWLGGDPLLSTFVGYPEGHLAGLIFHELAHQQLYVDHDSAFNESFATAVEQLGGQQWLRARPEAARAAHAQSVRHRDAFRDLQRRTRAALAEVYAQHEAVPADTLARKAQVMQGFRDAYAGLKARWAAQGEPDTRFDAWVAKANNASFGMQAVYQGWVPAFEAMFRREGCDWPRFYAAAATLAEQPRPARDAALQALMPSPGVPAGTPESPALAGVGAQAAEPEASAARCGAG